MQLANIKWKQQNSMAKAKSKRNGKRKHRNIISINKKIIMKARRQWNNEERHRVSAGEGKKKMIGNNEIWRNMMSGGSNVASALMAKYHQTSNLSSSISCRLHNSGGGRQPNKRWHGVNSMALSPHQYIGSENNASWRRNNNGKLAASRKAYVSRKYQRK